MKEFKATNKQIIRDEISFSEIKVALENFGIDTLNKLSKAKKSKLVRLPGNAALEKLCVQKTGKSFKDFFEFKRSKTKPRLKDKLLNQEFINDLKSWCEENSIESINQYINADVPKRFPSAERIRQVYGYDYFADVIKIHGRNYDFLTKEQARKVCLENGITASQFYTKFYQKYNQNNKNILKLPSDPFRYYKTNWSDFIQLSETQLFIGNGMSTLELFTYKLLYDRAIPFEMQKTYDDCRSKNPLPFDFYLPEINTLIELDGSQHESTDESNLYYSKNTKKHDKIKNQYCLNNKIKLIRISELLEIETTLNKEIGLYKHSKIRELDWTKDFSTASQVLESELSKSIKVKLLLLMAEKGKCNLTNQEIIKKVGCFKSLFYGIKNELINLSLISRETDYYIDEEQEKKVVDFYNQGKSVEKIKKLCNISRFDKILEILEKNDIKYETKRTSKNDIDDLKKEIIKLFKQGLNNKVISKKLEINPSVMLIMK